MCAKNCEISCARGSDSHTRIVPVYLYLIKSDFIVELLVGLMLEGGGSDSHTGIVPVYLYLIKSDVIVELLVGLMAQL